MNQKSSSKHALCYGIGMRRRHGEPAKGAIGQCIGNECLFKTKGRDRKKDRSGKRV